ncbi:glycosyltransferase family 2 protein [Actibacterium lipolyticum]|uniref:Putative glycosyltransferase YkoT n=1 Tax=Actibacterium lipolyticum TaxID=1524263 RepID=A0A238KNN5_9RHOB|nr:glycosyltransferase family 2 protein [Actibacterium lipolyticum]SMX43772.1 putative glycosyltransferase YkoT [Actibacterium lipolyticum]
MSSFQNTVDVDFPTAAAKRAIPRLSIVVPCHNEELALPALFERLERLNEDLQAAKLISQNTEVVLVDDGSYDATWKMIETARTPLTVRGIKLSRNQGHQQALFAGLIHAGGDVVVSMDADLQDDPDAVIGMIRAYLKGADIVFGVRASRESDTWFKRASARTYYRILERLGVDLIPDHADFRLMSRKSIRALRSFEESNLFLRGLVRQLGFTTDVVTYDRSPRVAGESKYTLRKMISLGLEGVTSFSVKPLRMIVLFGFAVAAITFLYSLYSIYAWARGDTIPGWTSVVLPLSLLGGVHLIALGVIGEYVGKIYKETKRRPRFIVDEIVSAGDAEQDIEAPVINVTANSSR